MKIETLAYRVRTDGDRTMGKVTDMKRRGFVARCRFECLPHQGLIGIDAFPSLEEAADALEAHCKEKHHGMTRTSL